jgi:hypothetical protein
MSSYNSKSQKRSQSKSKNGGRRKKRTLKNVRRRKSRKVMRGGTPLSDAITNADANDILIQYGLTPISPVSDIKSSPYYEVIKKRLLMKNIDIDDAKYNS